MSAHTAKYGSPSHLHHNSEVFSKASWDMGLPHYGVSFVFTVKEDEQRLDQEIRMGFQGSFQTEEQPSCFSRESSFEPSFEGKQTQVSISRS